MTEAALAFDHHAHVAHEENAFRAKILLAMRDLRARERRASSPDLVLGVAANDPAPDETERPKVPLRVPATPQRVDDPTPPAPPSREPEEPDHTPVEGP